MLVLKVNIKKLLKTKKVFIIAKNVPMQIAFYAKMEKVVKNVIMEKFYIIIFVLILVQMVIMLMKMEDVLNVVLKIAKNVTKIIVLNVMEILNY